MKKILCPVDFSDSSMNGVEYASRLTRDLGASLTLLNVRTSIWPEAMQLEQEVSESNEALQSKLTTAVAEIQKEFGIPCHYHVEQTTDTLEGAISALASQYDLVVMGTNGADSFYQYAFGSNSYHVIEKSKCPIIVVPITYTYRPLHEIIYAYDPSANPIFLVEQLKQLSIPLKAAVKVLHITEDKASEEARRKMEILEGAIKARESKAISWTFDYTHSGEVGWTLDHCMKTHDADMLALSFHHRSLMEKLFTENVVKQISMVAHYPVFIFWH
jgi:nucleotide-binding universal stress UspA family protein